MIKALFYYYLAGLTWLVIFLMVISIVFIPVFVFLVNVTDWWCAPFEEAGIRSNINKIYNERKNKKYGKKE